MNITDKLWLDEFNKQLGAREEDVYTPILNCSREIQYPLKVPDDVPIETHKYIALRVGSIPKCEADEGKLRGYVTRFVDGFIAGLIKEMRSDRCLESSGESLDFIGVTPVYFGGDFSIDDAVICYYYYLYAGG